MSFVNTNTNTNIKTKNNNKNKNSQNNKTTTNNKLKKGKSDDNGNNGNNGDLDDEEEDSDIDEMSSEEYQKFLSKLFPSKYMKKKIETIIEEGEEEDDASYEDCDDDEEVIENTNTSKKSIKESTKESTKEKISVKPKLTNTKKSKSTKSATSVSTKPKTKKEIKKEEEEEDDEDEEEKSKEKVNIILTIGGSEDYDYTYEDDEEDDDDYSTEDEDEEVSDVNTEDEDDEDDDDDEEDEDDDDDHPKCRHKNSSKHKDKDKHIDIDISQEIENNEVLKNLKEMLEKTPDDKFILKCIKAYEDCIREKKHNAKKKENKQKDKNMRIFKKIIKDKNTTNDFLFYEKLNLENQKKIIKELKEVNKIARVEKPYRITLLEANVPIHLKAVALKKLNSLRHMEPGSGEYYKIKNWIDAFMRIPFMQNENLPISIEDGIDKCHDFMEISQQTLDQAVYGLNDAKMQLMQLLGNLITNPKAIGTAIAIHGPPGTGKTSLIKEGVSKILNKPFAFIPLGGATDSSFLEGHGYTYEGSTWGKIVQILIDSKCMNPVIYFDELDKISDTPKGEEIASILTHLTDTTQNTEFQDKYFSEIKFDLSKCLFIFSYNDESKVNPILKDRMYRIKTKGYIAKEKIVIANNYLLPKIREQVKFQPEDILIEDDVMSHIIETHCNKEDGVRNLKRCLEIIYTKLNLYRLMKPGSTLFNNEISLNVEFPYTITKNIADKLIKREDDKNAAMYSMYV